MFNNERMRCRDGPVAIHGNKVKTLQNGVGATLVVALIH